MKSYSIPGSLPNPADLPRPRTTHEAPSAIYATHKKKQRPRRSFMTVAGKCLIFNYHGPIDGDLSGR
jgi:hypothetical protein